MARKADLSRGLVAAVGHVGLVRDLIKGSLPPQKGLIRPGSAHGVTRIESKVHSFFCFSTIGSEGSEAVCKSWELPYIFIKDWEVEHRSWRIDVQDSSPFSGDDLFFQGTP